MLETVYGASRIYYDLVSLGENVGVKQEALRAARKLQEDDQAQVDFGTLAPIELVRAKALVELQRVRPHAGARALPPAGSDPAQPADARGSPVFNAAFTEIVPTDKITVPPALDATPVTDLIEQGLARRPDLAQIAAAGQSRADQRAASRNQALPQLNAYVNVETRGSTEQAYEQLGTPGTAIPTLPQTSRWAACAFRPSCRAASS